MSSGDSPGGVDWRCTELGCGCFGRRQGIVPEIRKAVGFLHKALAEAIASNPEDEASILRYIDRQDVKIQIRRYAAAVISGVRQSVVWKPSF